MRLKGTNKADVLRGSAFSDLVEGGRGNDFLDGSGGNDTYTGGDGADTFVLRSGGGHDVVTDSILPRATASCSITGPIPTCSIWGSSTMD